MSFVIRCGTPDCDWGQKMCDLGEDQLRLCSRKTNFRTFHQRRIIIEGNCCAIYSASEVIGIKARGCRVVVVKAPRDDWADFQLYLTKIGVTYVVPRGHIPKTTTLSLNSPVLIRYENAWDLLARSG